MHFYRVRLVAIRKHQVMVEHLQRLASASDLILSNMSSTNMRIVIDDSMHHENSNNATLRTELAFRPSSYMQSI
jgi:hypothetical protein